MYLESAFTCIRQHSIESPLKCRNIVCIMHGALPIFRMHFMGALCHALERFCVPGPGSIHA